MEAVRIETTVLSDGRVILDNLPFDEGEKVEVIVREAENGAKSDDPYPLRGTLYKYDDPFEPVTPIEDWEVLK